MPSKNDEVAKDESKVTDPLKKPKTPAKPAGVSKVAKPAEPEVAPEKVEVSQPEVVKSDEPAAKPLPPVKLRDVRGMVVKVAAVLVTLLAVVVLIFGVLIYAYRSDNPAVTAVASVVPYPVERVNGHFVTYKSYLFEVDANKRAYQNNAKLNNQPAVDFNSADGKKLVVQIKQHALDKLADDSLTAQLASQKKIKVSDKNVDDLINQLYTRYGGKDTLLKTLKQIYGWNIGDLRAVVYKQLLAKDLEDKVTSDPAVTAAAKTKAQNVLGAIKGGQDFTDAAKKSSQASDAASGGDMGFFTKGQLPDEVQKAAEALQPGQVSDPVKVAGGFVILKVIEKKDDGSIHAQEILIKTVDFTEYFAGEKKKAKVNKYIKV